MLKRTKRASEKWRGLHTTRRSKARKGEKKSLNKHEETINQNVNNENVEKCCVCGCMYNKHICYVLDNGLGCEWENKIVKWKKGRKLGVILGMKENLYNRSIIKWSYKILFKCWTCKKRKDFFLQKFFHPILFVLKNHP